jgi:hypothetical protein
MSSLIMAFNLQYQLLAAKMAIAYSKSEDFPRRQRLLDVCTAGYDSLLRWNKRCIDLRKKQIKIRQETRPGGHGRGGRPLPPVKTGIWYVYEDARGDQWIGNAKGIRSDDPRIKSQGLPFSVDSIIWLQSEHAPMRQVLIQAMEKWIGLQDRLRRGRL